MVQINITGETAQEALKDLAALNAGLNSGTTAAAKADYTAPAEPKKRSAARKEKVAEPDPEDEDAVSLQDVQVKMKEILAPLVGKPGEKELRAKIKGVFGDFNAVSTSTLKPEDYGKVIEAFDGLSDDLE